MNQFKEYIGKEQGNNISRRTSNFLVYSIYENEIKERVNGKSSTNRYVGILSNFFFLKPDLVNNGLPIIIDSSTIADSIKAAPVQGTPIDTFSIMDSIKAANH